jgi:hypothetical protein
MAQRQKGYFLPNNRKERAFHWIVRRVAKVPEGALLPNWTILLRIILFPLVMIRWRVDQSCIPGAEFIPETNVVRFGRVEWSIDLLGGAIGRDGRPACFRVELDKAQNVYTFTRVDQKAENVRKAIEHINREY